MRWLAAVMFLSISAPVAVFAQGVDCKATFALESGTGHFTTLSLFNFGNHFELQAETPSQRPADQFKASIDGRPLDAHMSLGLDDLLVAISTDPANFEVTSELLDALSKGDRFEIAANVEGKAEHASFSLKGSAAAIRRLKAGCK